MGAHKKWTDEEREAIKKANYKLKQKPKEEATYKRLAPIRIDEHKKLSKKEASEFHKEIKSITKLRFESILNNETLWEEVNSTSDDWAVKKARQDRKKRNGGGKWVSKDEIDRAEKIIWGGIDGEIFREELPNEYHNPYGELPE